MPESENSDDGGVSLGELSRNLRRVESSINGITGSVNALRAEIMRDVDQRLSDRLASLMERVDRLEKVLYGAVGIILLAFLAALAAIVYRP